MLIKTDASGNRQWEKVVENSDGQIGCKLLVLANGNVLLAGNVPNKLLAKQNVILCQLDPDGGEVSRQQLAKSGTGQALNDLQIGPSGDLVVAAYGSGYLTRLDMNGSFPQTTATTSTLS